MAANALSDTRGLAEDFLKACDQTFPHASRKSFDHPHEAGRWFRLHREGVSWADLARQKVRKERPDLDEDSASFLELVGMERKAIREYTRRWWQEYGYKIAEILLPDLEE